MDSQDRPALFNHLPRGEFRLSELADHVDIPQKLDDPRQVHTAFAGLLIDVDRSRINGADKADIIQGLVQAWTRYAEEHGDVDVEVTHHRMGFETEVIEPED